MYLQDNVFVNVEASVQYQALADKASDAFYKLSNPRAQIQAYVFDGMLKRKTQSISIPWYVSVLRCVFDCSVIRASVPKLDLDDVFEQKKEIAKAVEDELEKASNQFLDPCLKSKLWLLGCFDLQAMSAYGYEIVQTLIVDIEPDDHVKRAMNEINAGELSISTKQALAKSCSFWTSLILAAARLRVAANEKAEAEKIIQIKRAEGEAESKYLSGVGIARQRQAIVDGLKDSVLGFSENVPGTTAKDVLDIVLITQYFDTMKEIGASSKSSSVFIPHGPGAVHDVAAQIRDGLLQSSSL